MGREEFKPIPDKRLWVRESEFANVLHQAKRDGNTLSPALRDGWDGESIDPAAKSNRVGVTRPHIGIAAGISPGELLSVINSRELSNGFANRFLTVHAERLCLVAEPAPPPPQVVAALAGRTAEVIRFALGGYPETSDTRPMHKSAAAREFWPPVYKSLCQPMETELLTTLLERRAPHLIRLAMLFALCDLTLVIELHHMQAALAWIDYHTDSVRYIFGRSGQQERTRRREAMAGQIAEFLKGRPEGASRMELYNDCFGKHVTPLPLDDVLKMMLADHRYGLSEIRTPRADGKAGRPKLVYRMSKLPAQESQELFNPNNPATALVADETDGAKESNSSAN